MRQILAEPCVMNKDREDHSSPSRKVDTDTKAVLWKTCQQCDQFVTCQEERELVLAGSPKGVGLSDVTISIHPLRFGEFCSYGFVFSRMSCNYNHTVCNLLSQACFTQHAFEIYPCCYVYQELVFFTVE